MFAKFNTMMFVCAAAILLLVPIATAAEMYEGRVMMVGEDTITVMGDMEMNTIAVTAETKIIYAGAPGKLNQILPGDKATIEADLTGGKLIAKTIVALRAR